MATFVFRTDASLAIGTGHVMRCLTLAEELRANGEKVMFICYEHPGNLVPYIQQRGFQVTLLPRQAVQQKATSDYSSWLGTNWHEDAKATGEILAGMHFDWLIVDHYALEARWEEYIRGYVSRIFVIDDLANRTHDCDLLLDQNLQRTRENRYAGRVPAACRTLLGTEYALLRKAFLQARELAKPRNGVRRILVCFGGTDSGNETGKTLKALKHIELGNIVVDVVLGAVAPNADQVAQLCAGLPNCHFHSQPDNLVQMMLDADLAIGAGGIMTWERCCLGLPTIAIAISPNQENSLASLAQAGGLLYLGRSEDVSTDAIGHAVATLGGNSTLLELLSRQAMTTVDGFGAARVASMMLGGFEPLTVRPAAITDATLVYAWRNHVSVRRWCLDATPLPYASHLHWFESYLENPDGCLLIGEVSGVPVGVLRFDAGAGNSAEVSIYLDPARHGCGLGDHLLQAGEAWLRTHLPNVRLLEARTLPGNHASLRLFEKAGYTVNLVHMRKEFK